MEANKSNREHSFDVELASIVGLEKSILLKNTSYWTAENKRRNLTQYFSNDIWWTEESLSSLARKYPYMKRASIGRWMQELHESGWLKVIVSSGGKNKYAPGQVFELWDTGGDWQVELSQNETVVNRPKMRRLPSQNETPTIPKWDADRPKMGYNNIDLDIESNIELNGKADKPPKPEKKEAPIIHKMVQVFETEHQKHFKDSTGVWIGFTWQVKEFGALKSLSKEFEKRLRGRGADFSEPAILNGWQTFLQMAAKADKFTLENHYTPTKLWSNFQGIIQKIQQKNGNHNQQANGTGQSRADKNKGAFERLVQSVAADGIR